MIRLARHQRRPAVASFQQRVARIDPTGKVRYDAVGSVAANCAVLIAAPGGYWLDDTGCSNSYYRWDDARKRITATVGDAPAQDWGAVVEFAIWRLPELAVFLIPFSVLMAALLSLAKFERGNETLALVRPASPH